MNVDYSVKGVGTTLLVWVGKQRHILRLGAMAVIKAAIVEGLK